MINQLNLFDPEKYSTPSRDGKPDWFYDTQDGEESYPSVSQKKPDPVLEQSHQQAVETTEPVPHRISVPLAQINPPEKITGGGNSTPGVETIPGAIGFTCSGGGNLEDIPEGDQHIESDRTGGENIDRTGEGDRHIQTDRTQGEPDPKNMAMLQNASGDRSCSVASDSTLLTEEEGRAFWEGLIFGRKTENPGRVALETTGKPCPDKPGRSHLKRVQEFHNTPDAAFVEAAINAIYSAERTLSDQRQNNGKPGASGWISQQFKHRDSEGKSRTTTKWIPGCTGPYFQYQWREGDRVRSRYVPRKKLEQVELALMTRESTRAILEILD